MTEASRQYATNFPSNNRSRRAVTSLKIYFISYSTLLDPWKYTLPAPVQEIIVYQISDYMVGSWKAFTLNLNNTNKPICIWDASERLLRVSEILKLGWSMIDHSNLFRFWQWIPSKVQVATASAIFARNRTTCNVTVLLNFGDNEILVDTASSSWPPDFERRCNWVELAFWLGVHLFLTPFKPLVVHANLNSTVEWYSPCEPQKDTYPPTHYKIGVASYYLSWWATL